MFSRKFIPYVLLIPIYAILVSYVYWAADSFLVPFEKHEIVALEDAEKYTYDRNGSVILERNEVVRISYYVERFKSCKMTSIRVAHNIATNTDYAMSSDVIIFKPEASHKIVRSSVIPDQLPSGAYTMKAVLIRECNPLETLFPLTTEVKILSFVIR